MDKKYISKIRELWQEVAEGKKKLDPVGKADADIDNDGDVDSSDEYLHNRRKAIGKAMKKDDVKEGPDYLGDIRRKKEREERRKASPHAGETQRQKTMRKVYGNQMVFLKKGYGESVEADIVEATDTSKYMWKDINAALSRAGLNPSSIARVLSNLKGKAVKEDAELEEATGKDIAAKMMKSRSMKAFAPKIAKMANVSAGDLEKMLPDYVPGAEIRKLFELDEISKKTLGSYVKKAGASMASHGVAVGSGRNTEKSSRALANRMKGMNRAADRLTKEHVEVDEAARRAAMAPKMKGNFGPYTRQQIEKAAKQAKVDSGALSRMFMALTKKTNESVDISTKSVDKALSHDCAKHVASEQWGFGECIPGQHTLVEQADGTAIVTHYDIMFEHGIEFDVPVEELTILVSESHKHTAKKMKEGDMSKDKASHDTGGFRISNQDAQAAKKRLADRLKQRRMKKEDVSEGFMDDYKAMKAKGKSDAAAIEVMLSMPKYRNMSRDQLAKKIGDEKRKGIFKEGSTYGERTKSAAKAETMKDQRKGKGANDMAADLNADNPELAKDDAAGHEDATKAGRAVKGQAPTRPGEKRVGDKTIVNPVKGAVSATTGKEG